VRLLKANPAASLRARQRHEQRVNRIAVIRRLDLPRRDGAKAERRIESDRVRVELGDVQADL
jgi:ribosomal protein L15E